MGKEGVFLGLRSHCSSNCGSPQCGHRTDRSWQLACNLGRPQTPTPSHGTARRSPRQTCGILRSLTAPSAPALSSCPMCSPLLHPLARYSRISAARHVRSRARDSASLTICRPAAQSRPPRPLASYHAIPSFVNSRITFEVLNSYAVLDVQHSVIPTPTPYPGRPSLHAVTHTVPSLLRSSPPPQLTRTLHARWHQVNKPPSPATQLDSPFVIYRGRVRTRGHPSLCVGPCTHRRPKTDIRGPS